ncbi:hypothetical protein L6R53_08575 [Myxococcota bacterium]|nr:hypothetical protein [Myxococcota bacterium]
MTRSLLAPLVLLPLLACGGDTVRIASGTWLLAEALQDGAQLDPASAPTGSMVVDAEDGTVELRNGDDTLLAVVDLVPRDEDEWPTDCPTNFGSTRMEVADLDLDEVDLGGLVIAAPAIQADCPTGDRLHLFAADTDRLGLAVCAESSACAVYE